MDHIIELSAILQLFLLWNKARCDCLSQLIIALFTTRTVNISILSQAFLGNAKAESSYKRIIRFLKWVKLTSLLKYKIAKIILSVLNLKGKKVHLSMDRTCWNFGKKSINFLVIGVYFHKISVPIFFKILPNRTKKGNSNTKHRITILKHAIRLVGVKNIMSFAADREFVGTDWFNYLVKECVPFVIRIKENTILINSRTNRKTSVKELCKRIRKNKKKIFKDEFEVWGLILNLAVARNDKGDLMIIASNINSKSLFKHYLKRWGIETFFKYLKKHGFNLEDTHIISKKNLEVMFFVLSLSVVWTLKVSKSVSSKHPLKNATHGRKRTSFFMRGLKTIRNCIYNITLYLEKFIHYAHLIISGIALEILLKRVPKIKIRRILLRMTCRPC